jgi:hypothetical protein
MIACSTVQHITISDMASTDTMKDRVKLLDDTLLTRLDDKNFQLDLPDHVFYLHGVQAIILNKDNSGGC